MFMNCNQITCTDITYNYIHTKPISCLYSTCIVCSSNTIFIQFCRGMYSVFRNKSRYANDNISIKLLNVI